MESFGKNVCELIVRADWKKTKQVVLKSLPNNMIVNVYVLGAFVVSGQAAQSKSLKPLI